MKTILIPTDFSDAAHNAARYGADFACSVHAQKIVLYNAYSIPLANEMTWALIEATDLKKASEAGLERAKMLLKPFCDKRLEIETISDFGFLGQRLNEVATEVHADMIIMGITGGGTVAQAVFGSNALTAVHNTKLPLLIVPAMAQWQAVEQIAWACDYKNIKQTTPLQVIDDVLQLTNAQLHVVHNDKDYKDFDPEIIQENMHLHEFFNERTFKIALLEGKDLSESVNQYVFNHGIDWLIVIPHQHNWLASIFTKSHIKQLAFHTHVPMLCLQQ